MAAQPAVSRALGRDEHSYWARRHGGRFLLVDRAQRLRTEIGTGGVSIRSATARLGLELVSYGYGQALAPVVAAQPRARANRVTIQRPGLLEWYINGPLGLEQGFTIGHRAPHSDTEPVTLGLRVAGNLRARLSGRRKVIDFSGAATTLDYRGLSATDARGRRLPAWFELRGTRVLLRVDDAGARFPVTIDPFIQTAKLTALDAVAEDVLGESAAISGDTIAVGASATVGNNVGQGAVYVFEKPPSGWADATQIAELTANDGAPDDNLGSAVAISGDTIVAGADGASPGGNFQAGAVYVFVEPPGGWKDAVQTAKLTADDAGPDEQDQLGNSVAISGDTIVAGALKIRANEIGSAYVFVEPPGGWTDATQTAELTAKDSVIFNAFGISVGISGTAIVVGAPGADVGAIRGQGAAYVFDEPPGGWTGATQTAKLTAGDGATGDGFGLAVAISGQTIVAGAINATVGGDPVRGAVYVFAEPPGGWADATQTAKLTAGDGAAYDGLGEAVALSGTTVAASAINATVGGNAGQGAVYVFDEPARGWADATETAKLIAGDGAAYDELGQALGLDDDTVVAGAPLASVAGNFEQGAAYVFERATSPTITSAAGTTFTAGQASSFTVTASGLPAPALSESGALPAGVSFADHGDGTASLSGVPAAGSAGIYRLTITAANGVAPPAPQGFTLTIEAPPAVAPPATVTAPSGPPPSAGKPSNPVIPPSNRFKVFAIKTHRDGTVTLRARLPGPGRVDVLETAWNDNLAHAAVVLGPANRRFVFARAGAVADKATTLHLRVKPNARGRRLVAHHRYRVTLRLWVSYTPTGGAQNNLGFYGLKLPKLKAHK